MEERLRQAKEATQRSAMIEKARNEENAEKEARLKKIREENEKKQKEQQERQKQLEQQKRQEQRVKAQQTNIVEPEEFILEEVNPQAPVNEPFGGTPLTNLEDLQLIPVEALEGGFEEIDESRFVFVPEQQLHDFAGPSHIQPQSLVYDLSTSEIQEVPVDSNKVPLPDQTDKN